MNSDRVNDSGFTIIKIEQVGLQQLTPCRDLSTVIALPLGPKNPLLEYIFLEIAMISDARKFEILLSLGKRDGGDVSGGKFSGKANDSCRMIASGSQITNHDPQHRQCQCLMLLTTSST